MILALKTADKTTEMYLYDTAGANLVREKKWEAGRQSAHDLLGEIREFLPAHDPQKLTGLVVYAGPGSFTGLRIGIATMNALAYALGIPIVGANGDEWLAVALTKVRSKTDGKIILPDYGAEANITKPKR